MLSEWSEVFSFTTKATINSVEDEIIESQLKVYPNPFRDYVNIKLNLLNSSDVVIEIYDLLGKNISQLADTYLPSGSHSFTLSSESLVNGMYILSVKIGDVKLSRQILFID